MFNWLTAQDARALAPAPKRLPIQEGYILVGFLALILLTRGHHLATTWMLPDASWALFFAAGFFLSVSAQGILLLAAVAIDAYAVGWAGVSDFCITWAYAALFVAYNVLWLAGRLAAQARSRLQVGGYAILGASVCELVSSGSFYWWSGYFEPSWQAFPQHIATYYAQSLGIFCFYVVLGAALLQVWKKLDAQINLIRSSHP
ncbi:hypothetical protein SAMN05421831_11233 [Allopseudospirillum japonicum]|uniref:Uncharacterized protein n=1 Tax=Allopseudospirillum japonicum TaxID=64971 RepID=A0A1H6U000_9GAMM|nr:hypothetical protein [Allopseudospirillum japonicum]SEI83794.1 hypothetical protein SAMN05421831_11233 [Allopseudospirillum japonicum]